MPGHVRVYDWNEADTRKQEVRQLNACRMRANYSTDRNVSVDKQTSSCVDSLCELPSRHF